MAANGRNLLRLVIRFFIYITTLILLPRLHNVKLLTYSIWNGLHEKLIVVELLNKFPHFTKPEASLSYCKRFTKFSVRGANVRTRAFPIKTRGLTSSAVQSFRLGESREGSLVFITR